MRDILFGGHQEILTDKGDLGQAWRQEKGSEAFSPRCTAPPGERHPPI